MNVLTCPPSPQGGAILAVRKTVLYCRRGQSTLFVKNWIKLDRPWPRVFARQRQLQRSMTHSSCRVFFSCRGGYFPRRYPMATKKSVVIKFMYARVCGTQGLGDACALISGATSRCLTALSEAGQSTITILEFPQV